MEMMSDSKGIGINKVTTYIFLFFVAFPYFSMGTRLVDTSLYALILSAFLFLFYYKGRVSFWLFSLLFLFIFSALFAFAFFEFNFLFLRTFVGYFSVFLIAFVSYSVLKRGARNHRVFFFCASLMWCLVGLIQAAFYPEFLHFLVVRSTTTPDRGVTSLAPEPTYFATISFFLFLICFVNGYRIKQSFFILIFSVFILAKSSTVAMVIALSGFLFILFNFRLTSGKSIVLSIFAVFTLAMIVSLPYFFLEGTRINSLVTLAAKNPEHFITLDGSVNARLWHLVGPYLSMISNSGLPQGFLGFEETLKSLLEEYPSYVHAYTYEFIGEKIQSGTGQLVYNLGVFGLFYFAILFCLAHNLLGLRRGLFFVSSIFLIMSTAVPISLPLFGFLFGYLAFKNNYERPDFAGRSKI